MNELIVIPADKSISHRAIILSALAEGQTIISNLLESEDVLNTVKIFRQLGVNIQKELNGDYVVHGAGLNGLRQSEDILDVGNSGTGIRLIMGVLAAQSFDSILDGDESIRSRPMDRVANPLRLMGAQIEGDYAPIKIIGNQKLKGINYNSPVASAQIKSCLMLAGLYADGETVINEPKKSRDHSERMFKGYGVNLKEQDLTIVVPQTNRLETPGIINIPSDISSAAFFMVLGLISKNLEIKLPNVSVNETRSGIVDVLQKMSDGKLILGEESTVSGEKVADITVSSSKLKAVEINNENGLIPRLIDEIPIIAVAACFAEGQTVIRDAAELKVKETNRVDTTVALIKAKGGSAEVREDGLVVNGMGSGFVPQHFEVDSCGDHRIAMSAIIAGLVRNGCIVKGKECIRTSFPEFEEIIARIKNA